MAIRQHADETVKDYFQAIYNKILSVEAHSLVLSPEFKKIHERITNSLIASIIDSNLTTSTNSFIVSALNAVYLIGQLASNFLHQRQFLMQR